MGGPTDGFYLVLKGLGMFFTFCTFHVYSLKVNWQCFFKQAMIKLFSKKPQYFNKHNITVTRELLKIPTPTIRSNYNAIKYPIEQKQF